jgi:hypothetical protein
MANFSLFSPLSETLSYCTKININIPVVKSTYCYDVQNCSFGLCFTHYEYNAQSSDKDGCLLGCSAV